MNKLMHISSEDPVKAEMRRLYRDSFLREYGELPPDFEDIVDKGFAQYLIDMNAQYDTMDDWLGGEQAVLSWD